LISGTQQQQQAVKVLSLSTAQASANNRDNVKVSDFTKRRPLVDAGLRNSDNDWLINFLTMPVSFILRRIH
jgi:hypothetical protein